MLASDDPRSYRHPSNAHPGQANSPLDVTANRWLKCRIRLVRDGIRTVVIPEVYVERGSKMADPATAVPRSAEGGKWIRLHDQRSGEPLQSVVVTGLPGGEARLERATKVWSALFRARALVPAIVKDAAASPSA